jgi:hypothetical protein
MELDRDEKYLGGFLLLGLFSALAFIILTLTISFLQKAH